MNLINILDLNLINIDLDIKNKDECINVLSTNLWKNNRIANLEKFVGAVYEREAIGETGMGNNIAIPHGLSEEVLKVSVAIAKLKNPIEWESLDDKPVKLVFLLAIPAIEANKTHIRLLSQLASILAYEKNIKGLMKCETKEEFLKTFQNYFDEYQKNSL